MEGVPSRYEAEIESGLSTHASPRLLGLFPGVYEYELYDPESLKKDLERIERQLRRRGYYEAHVYAARILRTEENKVRVEIGVTAGERVRIRQIQTSGLSALPFDVAARATRALSLKVQQPFDEDAFEDAKQQLANALADDGYAHVRVNGTARVDVSTHQAVVSFEVQPGPRATFGPIRIEGLKEVPEGPVRDALQLREGDTYSRRELELARTALFQLGVFSKVEIVPHTGKSDDAEVPVTIRVDEAPLRDLLAGAGVRLDVLRLATTGRIGWTHRNFAGGLRKFTISSRPGLTFFPLRVDHLTGVERLLPENSLTLRLEQPSFLEGRTRGFIETGYNVYPLLYPLPEGADPSQERIIGYNEITASVGVERNFVGHLVPTRVSMNWRANMPFTYQGQLSDIGGLEDVFVAYPEIFTALDLRDDPIQPTKGFYFSNTLQVAVPTLAGLLTDIRIRPEARAFVPLDYSRKLILAARVAVGFTFPQDYGDRVKHSDRIDPSDPDVVRDQHKHLFRAFYSGGPDSNRGYPYQRIGPQGPISFLLPSLDACDVPEGTPMPRTCLRPLGGFSMWEASLELRWKFADPWGLVTFIDASDVSSRIGYIGFQAPHISIGPGLRYNSPVGPIRVDLGWRVPGLQKLGDEPGEARDISEINPYLNEAWWQAFALHILIGEAF